jgi:hypothetical protein
MTVTIVSGIPPGSSGTGRFMTYLARSGFRLVVGDQYEVSPRALVRRGRFATAAMVIARYYWRQARLSLFLLAAARQKDLDLIVMHPQSLGMQRTIELLEAREHTGLYLLDSSFFCIRSYNFRAGEDAPCLACLGNGGDGIARYGCQTWPTTEVFAHEFVVRLKRLVKAGRVQVFAQNPTQARLATVHFGVPVEPYGLWTGDWDDCFTDAPPTLPASGFDVVLHGAQVEAKGAYWLARVAELCPNLQFLMPFPRPLDMSAPDNCNFRPMSWETGLREAVEAAPVTIVPSLWSASIEGALVKSLVVARAVAVRENESAYAADLPDGLALVLPRDVASAAEVLRNAVASDWRPEQRLKADWVARFHRENFHMANRLRQALQAGAQENMPQMVESLDAS